MSRSVTWKAANARRLSRQFAGAATPAQAVERMLAAQAQVPSAAELSVALRLCKGSCSDVRDAVADRSLVRAPGLRGTIHVVTAADPGVWVGVFATMPAGGYPAERDEQPTPAEVDLLCAAIGDAVADGEPLTLTELHDGVLARAGSWAGDLVMPAFQQRWPRWRLVQAEAARRGLLCFGPNRGRAVTYTAPPAFERLDPATAASDLLLRYLGTYGPATPAAYARWHAAPLEWARAAFETLARDGRTVEVDLDGEPAWLPHDDLDLSDPPARGLRLLPYFDALVIAAHPRERFFPRRAGERALAGGQAGNFPVMLIDGVVAGVWHQRRAGRRVRVTVEPLDPLSRRRQDELEVAVHEIARLQGLRPEPHHRRGDHRPPRLTGLLRKAKKGGPAQCLRWSGLFVLDDVAMVRVCAGSVTGLQGVRAQRSARCRNPVGCHEGRRPQQRQVMSTLLRSVRTRRAGG